MTYNLRPYPYPGKFEGGLVIDEYVYSLSVGGSVDEEAGDISEYGLWAGLMYGSLLDEHSADEFKLSNDEREFLKTRAGAIITEDDLGFVTVKYFEGPTELEEAWEELFSSLGQEEAE